MSHITWNDAGLIFLFCLAVALCWKLLAWVRRGEIKLYDDSNTVETTARAKNPIEFWLYFAMYAGLVGVGVWAFGGKWLELARRISN